MTKAQEQLAQLATCCGCGDNNATDAIDESLERARVVGVLDAWARADDERYWVSGPTYGGEGAYCTLWHVDNKRVGGPFQAQTEDAARAAAAKAIESGEV